MEYEIKGNTTNDIFYYYHPKSEYRPIFNPKKCDYCKFLNKIEICSKCMDIHPWGKWEWQDSLYELKAKNFKRKRKIEELLKAIEMTEIRIAENNYRIDNNSLHISWVDENYDLEKKYNAIGGRE
jgi:hypothetical protein